MDVDSALMNAPLQENVYIDAPEGQPSLPEGYVYKLNKARYGLCQKISHQKILVAVQ